MSVLAQSPHEPCQAVLTIDGSIGSDIYRDSVNPCKSTKSEKAAWENMPMTATVERKYALTKIAASDYLLPSNDAHTVWRITTYEDGPSHGVEGMPKDVRFWGVWKWTGGKLFGTAIDPDDWGYWDFWDGNHATRAEAINAALRMP